VKLVFTNGCFDLLHEGHVAFISWCRMHHCAPGDLFICAINSDASVRRLKGEGRPIDKTPERIRKIMATGLVDHVPVFFEDTPVELIKAIKPDILIKGSDYKAEELPGYGEMISWGGQVIIAPASLRLNSTSDLIKTPHVQRTPVAHS
jgi:D-beta-D-heptose 7-phosphate kinase/D-beta-D-heptose 1-phosphate adenosyltransferase